MKNVSVEQAIRRDGIFENILQQLHNANRRFHNARLRWEEAIRDTRYGYQERVEQGQQEIRDAEGQLERIDAKIKAILDAAGDPRPKDICDES